MIEKRVKHYAHGDDGDEIKVIVCINIYCSV